MNLLPVLGSVGSIVLVVSMGSGDGGIRHYLAGGMFLLATLGFVVVQVDRQRTQGARSLASVRSEYLRHLATVRSLVREAADGQRKALTGRFPAPASLPAVAALDAGRAGTRERSPVDASYLHVRYGVRDRPLPLRIVPPDDASLSGADPASVHALRRLLDVHGRQRDLPAALDLRRTQRVEADMVEDVARAWARGLVCSAAATHSPDHLVVAVLAAEHRRVHWDWVKWLPHAGSPRLRDAVGPQRLVASSPAELVTMLPRNVVGRPDHGAASDGTSPTPHLVVVLDGLAVPADHVLGRADGVTLVDLAADPVGGASRQVAPTVARFREAPDRPGTRDGYVALEVVRDGRPPTQVRGDQCDVATAEALARRLAPLATRSAPLGATRPGATRPGSTHPGAEPSGTSRSGGSADVLELLGLGDVDGLDPEVAWRARPARDHLRVPIGRDDSGGPVHLDLKESAQQGMGPHGLVVGATGSGKSELLRTLVLGLAATHSPARLNLVLVDFKGGATFTGMADLPHVSAVITNLSRELPLVDRMQDALSGELVRRQELLRAAGDLASVHEHEALRSAGHDLPPMPSLLVVVDEFSELLSAKPELVDLFVAIGRLGRSLGIHLLLATQRLEEGRLRGLESHLSYRIGLRTFSAQESRAVLGVPDAHELPALPGLGYLKPEPTTLQRFTAAYVSGPPPSREPIRRHADAAEQGILPFTITPVQTPVQAPVQTPEPERAAAPDPAEAPATDGPTPTVLDVAVRRMAGHGPAAHRVWLPPLEQPDTLDALFGDLVEDADLGLVSPSWRRRGGLTIPLGTVDRPRAQRRDTLTVDLSGAAGHVAVVGGPRSGRSTLLRTIMASTALVSTPLETQFFVLDLAGGAVAMMAGLPHVAGVGTRSEPDVVRRVVAEVAGIVDRREAHFRAHGIDSIETYRERRRRGPVDDGGDGYGDVFLVIDGWSTLRADFDDLELDVQQLAGRGLTFGVHVVVGATRWSDLRASVRDVLGTRLELRLGDPVDSEVDRRGAALVPTERPGRGLVRPGLHFLGALPRLDGSRDPATLGEGIKALVARVASAWRGQDGPKLRLLPESVHLDDVRRYAGVTGADGGPLLLGLDERALAPVPLDLVPDPHLLVLGEGRSGKSAVLRAYLHEVVRTRTPQQAQVVVVDPRRSLLGEVPEDHLLHYLTSVQQAVPALTEVAAYLERRLPGPDVTPGQLRARSWWQGAEVFVVVDDHDLVATAQGSPVAVLAPLLAQSRDVGLHLVVARRTGGAARALYEPVVQSLRDLAAPGLMLSGDPDEGPLLAGLRPVHLPPGRGRLVTRDRGVEVVQTAWTEPRA